MIKNLIRTSTAVVLGLTFHSQCAQASSKELVIPSPTNLTSGDWHRQSGKWSNATTTINDFTWTSPSTLYKNLGENNHPFVSSCLGPRLNSKTMVTVSCRVTDDTNKYTLNPSDTMWTVTAPEGVFFAPNPRTKTIDYTDTRGSTSTQTSPPTTTTTTSGRSQSVPPTKRTTTE